MEETYKILENVIPKLYQEQVHATMMDESMPWHVMDNVTYNSWETKMGKSQIGFGNSNLYGTVIGGFLMPLLYAISEKSGIPINNVLRIRAGFNIPDPSNPSFNTPHTDATIENHWTACYYVHDSDGSTVLFNETLEKFLTYDKTQLDNTKLSMYINNNSFTKLTECEPKQGRAFVFKGKHYHSSTCPTNSKYRIVITFNWT